MSRAPSGRRRRGVDVPPPSGLAAWPRWVWWLTGALAALLVLGGGGFWSYHSLDRLYPQELWKYYRAETPLGTGSVLYRNADGQLFLAPVADLTSARQLRDAEVATGVQEFVRDAIAVPGLVGVFATERATRSAEQDVIKVLSLDGGRVVARIRVEDAGEPLLPTLYASASGRYLALTSRDHTHVYYFDLTSGGPLLRGQIDTPPERMLWNRNGDVRAPSLAGQRAFATSPDGKLRAQVREGKRRAPECEEAKCEAAQELVIAPATIAGDNRAPIVLHGAFSSIAAEGWGPIPAQPAQQLYGRVVWSPDGSQVLFSALDGAEVRSYAIGVDGKTRPRLILPAGEALDWIS